MNVRGFSKYSGSIKKTVMILSFLLPALVSYVLFMVFPIEEAIRLSFFDWNGNAPVMNFVGLDHYVAILNDPIFIQSLLHNLYWVCIESALVIIPVLVLSIMITRVKRGKTFFRTAFYLPAILSLPVVAVIWGKIYDPFMGPINAFLKMIGLESWALNWLGDPVAVMPALIVAGTWFGYGFYMILYLAGLQGIDYSLYEAAELDGAQAMQKLWHITIPSLRNTMTLVISLVIMHSLKGFAMVWVATQGGPFYKSEVVATYIYRAAFNMFEIGYGAAASVILSIIVIVITVAFIYLREKGE